MAEVGSEGEGLRLFNESCRDGNHRMCRPQLSSTPIVRVAVIGGGRWARVLAGILDRILPTGNILSVHSRRNIAELEEWSYAFAGERRILVSEKWPELTDARDCAVIVVNAARDHVHAVERALDVGAPVLVEKPVALTALEVENLIGLSRRRGARFATAHVFMFARYLDNFRQIIAAAGPVLRVRIRWADPRAESRYGENKQYDPGLPMYADWLPHMSSILTRIIPGDSALLEDMRFLRGGAHLVLELSMREASCLIDMERNSEQRERFLEVDCLDGMTYKLDFSLEPGRIHDGCTWIHGDREWETSPRPVATMLDAFLKWASGEEFDPRLDCEVGLCAGRLIDQARQYYVRAQSDWLVEQLSNPSVAVAEDLEYALGELVQSRGKLPASDLNRRIEHLRRTFAGKVGPAWLDGAELA